MGKLFKRKCKPFDVLPANVYKIWFPDNQSFETNLLEINVETDTIEELDSIEIPSGAKNYSDGSKSWWEEER